MAGILQSDKTAILTCILYEALLKRPVYEAYKKLCKIRGKYDIDYEEFDYHYYRFYNGDLELDNQNTDTKIIFSDLPVDVLSVVIKKLDIMDRLALRKVSKNLREVVDDEKLFIEEIRVVFKSHYSLISFGTRSVKYISKENGCALQVSRKMNNYKGKEVWICEKEKYIKNGKHLEMAIVDLVTVLTYRNQKKINYFSISVFLSTENEITITDTLNSLKCQIDVESFSSNDKAVLAMLPHLNPSKLKSIHFGYGDWEENVMDEVMNMEQWKNAEVLHLRYFPISYPFEKLFHFKHFHVSYIDLTEAQLVSIRDSLLKHPHFESCSLELWEEQEFGGYDFEEEDDDREEEEREDGVFRFNTNSINRVMSQHSNYDAISQRYQIPNANYYFQFEFYMSDSTKGLYIKKSNIITE